MSTIYLVTTHFEKTGFTGAKLRRQGFLNAKTAHRIIQITRMNESMRALICFAFKVFRLQVLLLKSSNVVVVNEGVLPIVNLKKSNKTFFLIHDLKNSTDFARKYKWVRWVYYFIMVRIHDAILTVSKGEKARLETVFRGQKILVSYNGVSRNILTHKKYSAEKIYDYIYVSNFAKHKNHNFLLCEIFLDKNICLVGKNINLTPAEHQSYLNKFTVISDVSENDLISLYLQSKALIFPSLVEGFGMPLVEAFCLDLPVYTSDLPVFRELLSLTGGTIIDVKTTDKLEIIESYPATVPKTYFTWESAVDKLVKDAFL